VEYQGLIIRKEGHTAYVTINNAEANNTMNVVLLQTLKEALRELEADQDTGVIVFTGTGKAFISGADISYMKNMTALEAAAYSKYTTDLYEQMLDSKKILIAAINGYALGAGTEFALACDIRIASPGARFGFPEVKLGIIPGGGGTQRLGRLIGIGWAKELILTGRIIKADTAAELGIINRVVEAENLLCEAEKLAKEIEEVSPTAVSFAKDCINNSFSLTMKEGIRYERKMFGLCFAEDDQKEGMKAFLEKRKPNYRK